MKKEIKILIDKWEEKINANKKHVETSVRLKKFGEAQRYQSRLTQVFCNKLPNLY